MNVVGVLRWTLVLPSAPFGFCLALFIGLVADSFAAKFYPPELVVSGLCTATWYLGVGNAVTVLGAVLAAVFVVLLPTLLAPGKRFEVAVLFYILGATAAFLMVGGGASLDALSRLSVLTALVTGAFSVRLAKLFLTVRPKQEKS